METIRHFYNWQFSGSFPDVPFAPDVDIDAITNADFDPMFLTLPIAEDNAIATDRFRYTPEFNDALMGAIMNRKVEGRMGHLKDEERETDFSVPAVIWVGAIRHMNQIWGKAYVMRNPEIRDYYRMAKAVNRQIATSTYGMLGFDGIAINEEDGTWTVDPKFYQLEAIDLAPPERAALQIERPFDITSHMAKIHKPNEDEIEMNLNEALAQMTVKDIELLPKPVLDAVIAQFGQVERVSELTTKLSDATVENAQLKVTLAQLSKDVFEARVAEAIDSAVKVDSSELKATAVALVKLHMGADQTIDKIGEAVTAVIEGAQFKVLSEAVVSHLSGPNLGNGTVGTGTNTSKSAGEVYEANINQVLDEYGVTGVRRKGE